ncbi:MAG: RNB domain-containing ribonuclease, partial [Victivallales bacterium]|nr:RNB domain-containing ribonuclease [Victivallales bacterium]
MKKEKKRRLRRIAERAHKRHERRLETVEGKITVTHSGFGFVTLPENEQGEKPDDIFIPAQFVGDAMDGDEVKVAILPPRPDHPGDAEKGPAGKVIAILNRDREELVGELLAGSRVRPLNKRMPEEIEISGSRNGAKRGDWVRVKLLGRKDGAWSGTIRKVLGRAGEIAADLDAVAAEYNLAPAYSNADNLEAGKIVPRDIEREDHTDALTLTIDPFDAKDFDDALSIAPGKNDSEVIVGVHISDVAAFIAPKSKFDQEAEKRAFSCYLPGRTLPMLPKVLTAKISLQAGVDSQAHTVFLTLEKATGKVVSFRRCHTLIRVDHRLNYEEVQTFLDHDKAPEDWSDGLKNELRLLLDVTRKMRQYRRTTEGFIEMDLPEIRVLCSESDNKILGLAAKIPRESEQLVEECMLAANSAVGIE